jgi:trehalose synthase
VQDWALVNALQRRAAVVLQKPIREGFGLTAAEAMWKGAAVGGIPHQIQDGVNGFLVWSVPEAPHRIVQSIQDDQRRRLGERARETVSDRFLLVRLLEQDLDLFRSFKPVYRLKAPLSEAGGGLVAQSPCS